MVIANLRDGTTFKCDIASRQDCTYLSGLLQKNKITGLSLLNHGVQNTLPKPSRFRESAIFGFESILDSNVIIGERIFVQAGKVRVVLTTTFKTKLVRCDLINTGQMKFYPEMQR